MGLNHLQAQEMIALGLVFFTTLLLSLVLTPLMDRLAWKAGLLDRPNHRKEHSRTVTRAGGVAIFLALFLDMGILLKWTPEFTAFWSGAAVLLILGVLDDKVRVPGKLKLLGHILAAAVFMLLGGIKLEELGDVLGTGPIQLETLAPWLTLLAIVGVINAFNLSDGLDGLAAGMAGIACLFFLPFAYAQESWIYLLILTGLLGALFGFLRFNLPPARLFMGDAGSMFLGYALAAAAIVLSQGEAASKQDYLPVTALIILSLPIWDTLFVMTRRLLHLRHPFHPDRLHLHHRLMGLGLSHQVAVSLVYGLMFFMGLCAWLVRPWPEWVQFYSLLGFFACMYTGIWVLEKKSPASGQGYPALFFDRFRSRACWVMTHATNHGGKVFLLVWAGFLLPAILMDQAGTGLLFYLLFIFLLIAIYFPWMGHRKHMPMAHGLMFLGVFSLLLVYNLQFYHTSWFTPYMVVLAAIAGIWSILRVMDTVRFRVIIPGGLEILFLGTAIVSPILLHYSFDIEEDFRTCMVHSFLQAIPLFCMLKTYLRRTPGSNRRFIVYILVLLLVLMVAAVF